MSESPTLAHSGNQAGVVLGTAAYMSPEQARAWSTQSRTAREGRSLDRKEPFEAMVSKVIH